jgi:hypothetical protein
VAALIISDVRHVTKIITPIINKIDGSILLFGIFPIEESLIKNKFGNTNEIEFAAVDPTMLKI